LHTRHFKTTITNKTTVYITCHAITTSKQDDITNYIKTEEPLLFSLQALLHVPVPANMDNS